MQVTKSQLVFARCLIGVVHGASFLDQTQKEVKQNTELHITFDIQSRITSYFKKVVTNIQGNSYYELVVGYLQWTVSILVASFF